MLNRLLDELKETIIGKDKVIRQILIALLCDGHVLIEDVPGVGKTTLAKSMAQVMDLKFSRIQFTPDLMPSDVLGYSIYNRDKGVMEFTKGPLHNHIVLADEINRTSPKTQSCLLEAMEERQVTVDGKTYPLEAPFLVIATQNPFEFEGTFPLPEAQLDRFLMKLSIGYPDTLADELKVALSQNKTSTLQAFVKQSELIDLREKVGAVHIDETISRYIGELVRKTRNDERILLGASPRGTIALHHVAQAEAFLQDRAYVIPEDVIVHVTEILAHRILLKPETRYKGVTHEDVLQSIIQSLSFPQKIRILNNYKWIVILTIVALVWALMTGSEYGYSLLGLCLFVQLFSGIVLLHNHTNLSYYYYIINQERTVGDSLSFAYDLVNNSLIPIAFVSVQMDLSRDLTRMELTEEGFYFKSLQFI